MNDLLAELDQLTGEKLAAQDVMSNRNKPPWVKAYNEFEADTTITTGTTDKGGEMIVLNWTNINVLQSDMPVTITEDYEEFPISRRKDNTIRGDTKFGFLIKSLGDKPLSSLNGQRVHYKVGLFQQKDRDGTVRLNERGFPSYEVWYWDVVSVGKGSANGSRPALDDAEFEARLPLVVGQSHADAMELVPAEVISRGLLEKRIKQVDGVYTLVSA